MAGSSIPMGEYTKLLLPRCGEPGHLVEYTTEVYLVTGFSIPLEYTRWLARVSPWVSIPSYYYPGVENQVTWLSIPLKYTW